MNATLTTIAVVVAATATAVYMLWAKAQEAKALQNTTTFYVPVDPMQTATYQQPIYAQPQANYVWDNMANSYVPVYNTHVSNNNTYYRPLVNMQNRTSEQPVSNSRRYLTQMGINRLRVQQNGHQLNAFTTVMVPPRHGIPGVPDPITANPESNSVLESWNGHRELVDLHDDDIPAHIDPFNGREFTKTFDTEHHYCEPSDYLEKEYYYRQPVQKNVQFNASSVDTADWYNRPAVNVPYFVNFSHGASDESHARNVYERNGIFNKVAAELPPYLTPTQEFMMQGKEMPIELSPNAKRYDKSSLPYVSPEEKYAYMNQIPSNNMCNSTVFNTNKNSPKTSFFGEFYRTLLPNETSNIKYEYYIPSKSGSKSVNNSGESHYSYIMNLSDDEFEQYMQIQKQVEEEMRQEGNSQKSDKFVTYSGHGEICGPENGGPDLSRFPLREDGPDPRRKIYIYDSTRDPKPLIKREGIPMRCQDVAQYWVDNGEAGNCGHSYGDPTRPTTPVSTHYAPPKPWEDSSYYNALFVDGGGIHYSYQDYLFEIRYRNIYDDPKKDPLIYMCPFDFETLTDLYHWREAVFTKYQYDPFPWASYMVWLCRDDVQQFNYFEGPYNCNQELAKVAGFRWFRQEKEKEAWKRERMNREKMCRRYFYEDRCLGIHNIKYCPLDPCEYISPEYYEGLDGNWYKTPRATDPDYYDKIADCKVGKYYNENAKYFGTDKCANINPASYTSVDYFGNDGYTMEYDYASGRSYEVRKPYEHRFNPVRCVDDCGDTKIIWGKYDPVHNFTPPMYNALDDNTYVNLVLDNDGIKQECALWDSSMMPEWFDEKKWWSTLDGSVFQTYEAKKMNLEYPIILLDQRIRENMLVQDKHYQNTAGTPDDPFVDVFNIPDWYPRAREINNILNRFQAPRGFRFTGDPELDRMRIWYFVHAHDNLSDVEKIDILMDRMNDRMNDPNYDPDKPSRVDGLSDNDKLTILMYNVGPGITNSDGSLSDLNNYIAKTWVCVDEHMDELFDKWEQTYFARDYKKYGPSYK